MNIYLITKRGINFFSLELLNLFFPLPIIGPPIFLFGFYLPFDDSLYLGKGNRTEVIVVHAYIVLCRHQHLQTWNIHALCWCNVQRSAMNMAKELPYVPIGPTIGKHRKMVQVYLLAVYQDIHLHGHILESAIMVFTQILHVVVPGYQIYLTVQSVQYPVPFVSTSVAEIAQMKYYVVR